MTPRIHLVNPSDLSFGVAVITPRWLYVLAAATGQTWGDPVVVDETLEPIDESTIAPGDVVGIGIHTGNAHRGYEIGRLARGRARRSCAAGFTPRSFRRSARLARPMPSSEATVI